MQKIYEVHLYLVDRGLVKWWCSHKVECYPDNEVNYVSEIIRYLTCSYENQASCRQFGRIPFV